MAYLKSGLAILACLVLFSTLFYWFEFNSDHQTNLAAEDFMKGDYAAASKAIHNLEKNLSKENYHLYLAYIAREKSSLLESSEELDLAEQAAQSEPGSRILLEIYLNQAFNAYLTRKPEAMATPLEKAHKISKNQPWVIFLQTLQEYLKSNYKPALDLWKKPLNTDFLSPWMKKTFTDTFDSFWYSTHLAQANIALGNYLSARQELEEESKIAKENQIDQINLLLGLSYIKEAEEKPFLASTPYYKLAFSYLNRVPMLNSRFAPYRIQILAIIQNQIKMLISAQSLLDLPFYTGILENWQDKTGLQQIQNKLIELIEQKSTDNQWSGISEILKILNHHLKPGQQELVAFKLSSLFDSALKEGNLPAMRKFWEAIRSFAENPQEVIEQISNKTATYILEIIPVDTPDLFLTTPYLEFWLLVESNPPSRYAFATLLLSIAEFLWIENQPEKALALTKISMNVPVLKDQSRFKQQMSSRLNYLYLQSEGENNAYLLHSILTAMKELNIHPNAKQNRIDITKELTEADSFLKIKNYAKAKEKSAWVLELEPNNQEALRITGLADYYGANYSLAKDSLKKIQNPNAVVKDAMLVINIIIENASSETNPIPQAIKNHLAGNEIFKRLGFGLLLNGNPKEALDWLSKISPTSPEIHAGKSYAYFLLGKWNQALEEYNSLPEPYKENLGLKRIAIESTAGLGNTVKAERMLKEVLNQKFPPSRKIPSFEYLKGKFFEDTSTSYIAGIFYKNWSTDSDKALSYLSKIKNPAPTILSEIGEIQFHEKNYTAARQTLQQALKSTQENALSFLEIKKILPLLAMTNAQMNYNIEAAKNFTDYFDKFPKEILYRKQFAKILMKLRRFDWATVQLEFIRNTQEFSDDEIQEAIICFIHLGKFHNASWLAIEYLLSYPMPLARQLKIAKLMLITGELKVVKAILHRVPEEKYRSLEVNMALIDLWMEEGNYETASKQIQLLQPMMENNVEGLVILAKFYANSVNVNTAIQFAKRALKLDPYNEGAKELLDHYEPNLTNLKMKLKDDPNNSSLQLEYAKQLIQGAILSQQGDFSKDNLELNSTKLILKELSQSITAFPVLYYLWGVVQFLQTDVENAQIPLKEAVRLDLSYSEAYQYLSKINLVNKQTDKAFEQLSKALHYEPSNSDLWIAKAKLFQINNNIFDAMSCLEKAIKYKPLNLEAYLMLGIIQLNSENPEDAKKSLEIALKIAPENVQVLKYLLMTLHHPFLSLSFKNKDELKDQQKSIYDKLHKLNPKFAEDTLSSILQEAP